MHLHGGFGVCVCRVCGSYADLHGGVISEALCDFTGGVHTTIRLKPDHPEHWALLHRAAKYRSTMGCGSYPGVNVPYMHTHTLLYIYTLYTFNTSTSQM